MDTINMRKAFGLLPMMSLLLATPSFAQADLEPAGSEGGIPKHYRTLPVPRGGLQSTEKNALVGHTVKDKQGKKVGTLENVIVDAGTGKIEVGVIGYTTANNKIALLPVSWRDMKIDPRSGEVTLNKTSDELLPATITADTKDISPDIQKLIKDMQDQIVSEGKSQR